MSTAQILAKLNAYKKNPEVFKSLSNEELADLVILVLSQVKTIGDAIETKKIDLDTKFSKKTEQVLKDVVKDNETLLSRVTKEINALIAKSDDVLNETATQLEERVQKAIDNIRNGENGIVTEEEIRRAAEIAASLHELPDFEELVGVEITRSGEQIRDALELLPEEERYQVFISDVPGLKEQLEELRRIRSTGGSGGIGKNQVYNFIAQAVADGTIPSSGTTTFLGLTDTPSAYTSQGGKLVRVNTGETALEFIDPPSGTGDVSGPASAVNNDIALFDGTTGKLIKDGGATIAQVRDRSTHTGTQTASTISDFDTEVSNNTDVAANTSARHDPVTVTDSSEIDFTLTGQNITASIVAGSIDESKLDTSVNASLDLADSAVQPGDLATVAITGAYSDLSGTPTLATVATTGAYSDLSGTPDLSGYQVEPVVVSGSLTASNDTVYHNVASATYTDPSPVEGKGFVVFVRNGTATVGGTGYSTAGTIVHRIFHSGAWANYVYLNSAQLASTYQPLDSDLTQIAGLADPGADRILFKDQSAGSYAYLTASTGLTISGTNMTVRTASTTQTGIIEIATTAEDVTGVDGTRATTPAGLTARLAAPGTIGGTTPGAITGTTITANTHVNLPAQTASTIAILDASKNVTSASTATYPSLTELAHVKGVTSAIQTQFDAKASLTGAETLTNKTLTAPKLTVSNLSNLGATEVIDWNSADIFYGTLDANVNITHSNEASGRTITLHLAYDASAQRTITWTDVDRWTDNATGAAPTTPSASGEVLTVTMQYYGTTCVASATGNYAVYA